MNAKYAVLGPYIHEGFTYTLLSYLILFLLENLFTGFVSNVFDLNLLLIPLFLLGISTSFFPVSREEKIEEVHTWKEYATVAGFTILTFIIIWYKLVDIGTVRIYVALGSSVLVCLMSTMLLFFPEEKQREVEETAELSMPAIRLPHIALPVFTMPKIIVPTVHIPYRELYEKTRSFLNRFHLPVREPSYFLMNSRQKPLSINLLPIVASEPKQIHISVSMKPFAFLQGKNSMVAVAGFGVLVVVLLDSMLALNTPIREIVYTASGIITFCLYFFIIRPGNYSFLTGTKWRYALCIIPLILGMRYDSMTYQRIIMSIPSVRLSSDKYQITVINRSGMEANTEKYTHLLADNGYTMVNADGKDTYSQNVPNTTVLFEEADSFAGNEIADILRKFYNVVQTAPLEKSSSHTIIIVLRPETL